ncbi:MAG: outer membrane protein [Hyphomicrobiaceae bacterium]|jgi:outer membrane immunogenic protein
MLKKCVSHAMAGMALLVLAAGAARADGPYRRGPGPGPGMVILEPPPIFTWSGFYIGGNIGAAWSNSTLTDDASVLSYTQSHSGFIGGGQLGYNYQIRNLVLGIEWDFDWTSIGETRNGLFLGNAFQASAETDWMTTLSGRVGLTVERWLMYMKIGGGWVHNSASITNLTTGASASTKNTDGAWLVGAGVEYAISNNWLLKAEYNYLGLSDRNVSAFGDTYTFDRDIQMLKFGINYKF